jgi:uncharacterized peroxidase-related enzyme
VGLAITTYHEASGSLREIYDRMRARPMPAMYRPADGGVAGIIAMHSLDPQLIPKVFTASSTLDATGPLTWPERELVNAITSRLNQCVYSTACHAEFLRVALEDDVLVRAVLADPRAVAASWPQPRMRAIAALALAVTEAPWTLSRGHLATLYKAGLGDEEVLHVVLLAAFFGHLNRIANAVQGRLDYRVMYMPDPPDRSAPPWPSAPARVAGRPAIDLARRPATATGLTEWRHYIFYSHDAPLTRRQRTVLARWVATWLGDGGISSPTDLTGNPLDDALRAVAEIVTLAPWRLDDDTFAPLRVAGFDDAAIFDVCATASSAGVFSRYEVAIAALGT